MDAAAIIKDHDHLAEARRPEEPVWRDLAALLRPDDRELEVNERRRREDIEVLDSTPLYVLQDFTGGIFGQVCNPADRWNELGVMGDPDLTSWGPVKQYLWQASNIVTASFAAGVSNFYKRVPAAIANVGGFGFGAMYQEEWAGRGQIIDQAMAIGELYLDRDPAGNYDRVDRKFMMSARNIAAFFGPRAPAKLDERRDYEIIHCVRPNKAYRAGRLGPAGMAFASSYCARDLRDWHVEGGYHELPYHVMTWNDRARSAYPTGPGHNARADMQTLQEIERSELVAAQFAAEPLILLQDESVLSAADIAPNRLVYGSMNDAGKATVQYLERKSQTMESGRKAEQRRRAIEKAFYYSLMQMANRPQMTATEWQGWHDEILRLMAPNLVHIQAGLASLIARRFRILDRAGQMPPPPPELANKRLEIVFVSPLAKVQKSVAAQGVLRVHQAIEQFALSDPAARDNFDTDVASSVVADSMSSVPNLIRDPRKIAEIRAARQQAQAQQAQLEQMQMAVSTAAEASHAQQAASLAKGRSQGR